MIASVAAARRTSVMTKRQLNGSKPTVVDPNDPVFDSLSVAMEDLSGEERAALLLKLFATDLPNDQPPDDDQASDSP
jgi:hypothetical protein